MELSLLNIFTIVAGFVALIFAIFLVSMRTERRLPNFLLALYLIWFIQDTLAQFSIAFIYPISPTAGMLISLTIFLSMPTVFLFVKSFIYRDFRLTYGSLVHLVPYGAMNLLLWSGYYLVILRGQFTEAYAQEFFDSTIIKMVYLSVYLQALIYYILIFLELKKYHQLLIENFSDPFMGNYRWLKQFILLILVLMMVGLVKNILRFSSAEVVFSYASVIVALNILFFISWMMIVALRQPGIFTGIYSHMQPVSKLMEERGKTNGVQVSVAKSNPASTTDPRLEKLYRHMESREPYLDTSLSMHDLAGQLDMNVRDLSLLINHTLNQHFFDFVNRYRIEKAKELLRDPENHRVTVLEVLYEVGFNSKSSFNTTFKKLTGMTPTQYRKSVVH